MPPLMDLDDEAVRNQNEDSNLERTANMLQNI
jgi:hypothetical protein